MSINVIDRLSSWITIKLKNLLYFGITRTYGGNFKWWKYLAYTWLAISYHKVPIKCCGTPDSFFFFFFFLYNFSRFKAFKGVFKIPLRFFLVINTFYCYCCSTSFFYSLGAAASLVDIFIFDRRCQAGSHFVSLELFSQCTVSLSTSALEGHLSNISHNLLWQSCFAFLCCFLYFPLFLDSYLYHNSS